MSDPKDTAAALAELLELLRAQEGVPVPATTFGRLRRTASAALRTGAGAAVRRLTGRAPLDAKLVQALVVSMGELKGVAMKMGQMLSYLETQLPAEARALLSVLQVQSQPAPFAHVEGTLRRELGERGARLAATLDRTPVASASIGQVHRGTLPDGTPVAVKVRHPGIREALVADFRGAAAGKQLARLFVSGAMVDDLVGEAQARFLEECDYGHERESQERLRGCYRDHPLIRIPATHAAYSGPTVLTTTWEDGLRFEPFAAAATRQERDTAGRALYEFYVGSVYRFGLFNCDPHPGNLLFREGGRLTVLDHGCVRVFDPADVRAIASLSRAVRADDGAGMRAALLAMGTRSPDGPGFAVTRELLRGFFGPVLRPGPHPMTGELVLQMQQVLSNKLALLKLQLPGRLLFLFRIRFGLHSVVSRLGAVNDWQALEEALCAEALDGS